MHLTIYSKWFSPLRELKEKNEIFGISPKNKIIKHVKNKCLLQVYVLSDKNLLNKNKKIAYELTSVIQIHSNKLCCLQHLTYFHQTCCLLVFIFEIKHFFLGLFCDLGILQYIQTLRLAESLADWLVVVFFFGLK